MKLEVKRPKAETSSTIAENTDMQLCKCFTSIH